jgi:hypothetical protein
MARFRAKGMEVFTISSTAHFGGTSSLLECSLG